MFYQFPKSTEVNRNLPKTKLYEQAKVNTVVKELFITQVDQIIWQNKLSPNTLNLDPSDSVPEIQIFIIKLKDSELDTHVLAAIDKAIPLPILFELHTPDSEAGYRVKLIAAFKQIKVASDDTRTVKISEYFATDWHANNIQRDNIPIALSTQMLYESFISRLLPYEKRQEERLAEHLIRIEQINQIDKKMGLLKTKLKNESQFKKKVKINADIKILKKQLSALI